MPSLSFTSLDRLIEPSSASSSSQAGPSADRSAPFSFYPPLYATTSHQRPPSPTAFSPSPYVLNFKRRSPVLPSQNENKESGAESSTALPSPNECYQTRGIQENGVAVLSANLRNTEDASSGNRESPRNGQDVLTESDVFEMELEKREISPRRNKKLAKDKTNFSDGSFAIITDPGTVFSPSASTLSRSPYAYEEMEFFDAADSVFSESASEDELLYTSPRPGRRLDVSNVAKLEEERKRRIKAEEYAVLWQRRWNEMAKHCSTLGVSVPFDVDEDQSQYAEALNQEFLVARLVGEAIARAVVRAERDEQLEHIVGVKNREISRLWDKLQYLELVNREMSQRNQEVAEITQRRKKRWQRRQKLALNGFYAAICIGSVGLLSYKFIPWDQTKSWFDSFLKSPVVESDPN